MPNLTDSHEWFLLRKLAEWLSQIKAQYHTLPINEHRGIHIDADHIELELRYTFSTIQKFSQSLSPEKFISCQGVLEQLCSLFDRLVAHPKAHDDSKGEEYPHLEALVRDLVNGSKQRVLGLYSDTGNLRDYLIAITECNNALNRLLAPPPLESAIQSSRRERKKTPWKNGKRRDQTIYVLETLFKHFKCGIPHEVLLKLIKNPNEDFIVQILQLMLPSCPELKSWQEVQYDNADLDDHSISLISDICTEVQQYAGQGKALILHVKEYTLYGASAGPITFRVDPSSKHSLDQLIKSGAFERPDVKSLIIKTPSIKFTPKEKRKLAVQLGYCLMDFFDADFNSNRIHFFDCLRPNSEKVPYLALDSRFLSTKDSYNFHLGHPTLLSFAKLLLELEYGQVIELEISPDSNQNRIAWSDLMRYTDILESNTSDSYLLSIRSCLSFHQKIRMNLESFDLENDADLIIRKTLYRSVVRHLEAALTEATPLSHKRRRESSPDSTKMTKTWTKIQSIYILARIRGFEFIDGNSLHDSGVTRSEARINFGWPKCREGFEIALICALQIESDAVEALFDVYYEEDFSYGKAQGDLNAYTTGKMAGHNVVLAFMPGMGKVNSANVAAGFRASFPKIKLGIVVGICGGAPDGTDCEKEVLLGDVIISNAVIQYDFGRQFDNQSVRRDTLQDNLGRPNLEIRAFLKKIKGLRGLRTLKEKTFSNLEDLCARDDFKESSYPGAENDILHHPTYRHKHHNPDACNVCAGCQGPYDDVCDKALESSCADLGCQDSLAVSRSRIEKAKGATTSRRTPTDEELREARKPFIHFGTVVSGDSVMKSGHHRDEIAKREGAIAFEMEGAGVWDSFPTVVIKSVCDYADSHKNKMWQKYAAATAAACTKAFLEEWRMTC
ncbi:hypothetical protein LI328DRAFT_169357 [Trichoderma asperelloides]|nr:hypothetical protein LI328DRAFT_169357 [Trichoderma asperelloides]